MRFISSATMTLLTATFTFVAGCQSSSTVDASTKPVNETELTCAKCQTTYRKVVSTEPGFKGPTIVRTRTVAEHECPECTNVAKDYFRAGKFQSPGSVVHSCKTCGGELKVCHTDKI